MLLRNTLNERRIANIEITIKVIKRFVIIEEIVMKKIIKAEVIFISILNLIKLINSINYRINSIILI